MLDRLLGVFSDIFSHALTNEELCKQNITEKKYMNSTITIADAGYYKQLGENFRVVGGCGMHLANLKTQVMPFGASVHSQLNIKMID